MALPTVTPALQAPHLPGGSAPSDLAHVVAVVEKLGADVTNLTRQVHTIEEWQMKIERRVTEVSNRFQTLQEDHFRQACKYERSQKTVTLGTQRALDAASAIQQQLEEEAVWKTCLESVGAGEVSQLEQRWEARWQEHQQWLSSLTNDVAAVRLEAGNTFTRRLATSLPGLSTGLPYAAQGPAQGPAQGAAQGAAQNGAQGTISARLAALEEAQRAVALSARRALQTALAVHQRQRAQEQEGEWEKCLEGAVLPAAELEAQCAQRFAEQDERLDKILQIVDTLVDKVQGALPEGLWEVDVARRIKFQADAAGELRDKIEWLEANLHGLACQLQEQQEHSNTTAALHLGKAGPRGEGNIFCSVDVLDTRTEKVLREFAHRLNTLQESRDEQKSILRNISHQLPDVINKLDQLWDQCQHYFPRMKEYEVHLGCFRAALENQKRQLLATTDDGELPEANFKGTPRSCRAVSSVSAGPVEVAANSLEGSALGHNLSPWQSAAHKDAAGQQDVLSGIEQEDSELKSRARTLVAVMGRLSADFDSLGVNRASS